MHEPHCVVYIVAGDCLEWGVFVSQTGGGWFLMTNIGVCIDLFKNA